jgi:uncharacterized protein (TIGR03067 family)
MGDISQNSAGPLAEDSIANSPLPLREGQGVRAAGTPTNLRSVPEKGMILWQAIVEELSRPQSADPENARRWPAVVAMLLMAAMLCGLGWLVLGVVAVRRQRSRSRPVLDGKLLELVDVLRAELGCIRAVEIRQCDDLSTAATVGWLRPVILLPVDWQTWTADQRRAVLAHEIAHARSRDFPALLFGQLALVLHFYHPLVHWLMNRLRLEQELAADAAAAGVSGGQRQYLTTIAELALRQQDRMLFWPARTFLPTRNTFLRRIAMLRDSKLRFDRLSPFVRLTTVGVVLLCGLLVAGLRGPGNSGFLMAADQEKPAAKPAEESIIGPWHADSVALLPEKGEKKTLPKNEQQPFSIIISEKNLTMRVGDRKVAVMSYTSDAKQTPATINVKFQDQDMPGIFELKDDNLKISLNDAKKGRPKDFSENDTDMDLVLQRFKCRPLMELNTDGTDLHILLSMPDYTCLGAPKWSHDGKKIACDGRRSVFGENATDKSHIITVNADGTEAKDLGDGVLPSWSPDGKRIVCGRYNPGNGVWIMNADGSNKQQIDGRGWGADWSPKKDELAYTVFSDNGPNLCVYDVTTKQRRNLLENDKYRDILWGLSWSPDGQWICFKGDLQNGKSEMAVVNAQGQDKGFKVLYPSKTIPEAMDLHNIFSWSPDGKQILAPLQLEGDANIQLYLIDPEGEKLPQKLAGQNPSTRNVGSSWSPDGKKIVISFNLGKPAEKKEPIRGLIQRILSSE